MTSFSKLYSNRQILFPEFDRFLEVPLHFYLSSIISEVEIQIVCL